MQEKGILKNLLVRMKISGATMEITTEFFKKLKIELPYDPVISLLVTCPKESKSHGRDIFRPLFITTLFTIASLWSA
jgi:hypothetical protein